MSLCYWRRLNHTRWFLFHPSPKTVFQSTNSAHGKFQKSSWKRELEISTTWKVLCGKSEVGKFSFFLERTNRSWKLFNVLSNSKLSNFGLKFPTSDFLTSFWTFSHITFELLDLSNSNFIWIISKSEVYFFTEDSENSELISEPIPVFASEPLSASAPSQYRFGTSAQVQRCGY